MKSNDDCISYRKIWLLEFSGHLESEYTISRIFKKMCMQDRKKDTDVYNGLLDSEGEGEGGMIWENGNSNMYTIM